jgi:hypothetical protein
MRHLARSDHITLQLLHQELMPAKVVTVENIVTKKA